MINQKYLKIFNEYYIEGKGYEIPLQKLKEEGASQMESVKVIMYMQKIKIKDADEIVVNSETWKDFKEITNVLRDNIFNAAKELLDGDCPD